MSTVITAPPAPSPATLRGRLRPTTDPRLHEFDVASELSETAVAWRIRDRATGEEAQFLSPRERGGAVLDDLARDVAAWVDVRSNGEPVSLRCFSIALRDAAKGRLDPEKYVMADLIALGVTADWAHGARSALRAALSQHDRREFHKRTLYGASDGSVHPFYGNGAYSWVTANGQFEVARSHAHILASEVMGILSFARAFVRDGTYFRAVLFVDSLRAIDAVTRGGFTHSRVNPKTMAFVRSLIETGRLELVWVRSHQGHLLNDIADRLALQRHRAVRAGLGAEQLEALCRGIVEGAAEELAETDWRQVARDARAAHRHHVREQAA